MWKRRDKLISFSLSTHPASICSAPEIALNTHSLHRNAALTFINAAFTFACVDG